MKRELNVELKNECEMLIFLHIACTGGATLSKVLENEYDKSKLFYTHPYYEKGQGYLGNKLKNEMNKSGNKIECVHGHMAFGLHKQFLRPCKYITMMRDPVEQIMSSYYWIMSNQSHPWYKYFISNNISLEDYQKLFNNMQTRWLLDEDMHMNPEEIVNKEITLEDLEKVKMRIKKYFKFIGITEMFDESLFLIKKLFGWQYEPFYRNECVSKKRPHKKDISSELLDKIKVNNKMDFELYNLVKENFMKKIESLNDIDKNQLIYFGDKNKKYKELNELSNFERNGIGKIYCFGKKNHKTKVLIFGASKGGQLTYDLINKLNDKFENNIEIMAFLDNDKEKWGNEFFNIKIFKPNMELIDLSDYIIISSQWKKEITQQLLNIGIDEDKIIYQY